MKVAIVGSRDFQNLKAVRGFVRTLRPGTTVITGGAAGVDLAAETAAREDGLQVEIIRPDYRKHHPKLAPKIRNREIAEKCDAMVAFWDGTSGGTANAVTWAAYFGKVVTVLTSDVIPVDFGRHSDVQIQDEEPSGVCLPDGIAPKDAAIDAEDTARIDEEHERFEATADPTSDPEAVKYSRLIALRVEALSRFERGAYCGDPDCPATAQRLAVAALSGVDPLPLCPGHVSQGPIPNDEIPY